MILRVKQGKITFMKKALRDSLLNDNFSVSGRREFSILPIEALYLMQEKNARVLMENEILDSKKFQDIFKINMKEYAVFLDLRRRGYQVNGNFEIKNPPLKVQIFYPSDIVSRDSLYDSIAAVVDDDLDCTYFLIKNEEIKGEFDHPDPYFPEGKGDFSDEEKRYLYFDLIDRKCKVKSGLKFGTEFIAYVKKEDVHSKYMIKILREGMEWIEVAGLARVANGVKKTLILAVKGEKFSYYSITWQRL